MTALYEMSQGGNKTSGPVTGSIQLSIVMPAYNEEDIIEASVREWYAIAEKVPNSELIVVNDRSKDGTLAVLERLTAELPLLVVVTPAANGGHGQALRMGFTVARGEYVFQTDSDRQHEPSEFFALWERRQEADFLLGHRTTRADGLLRKVITTFLRGINSVVWGAQIQDANCPFKLMRNEALQNILRHVPWNCFIPMVFVSILLGKFGYRSISVPVTHYPRKGGTQSLKGLWRWVTVCTKCTFQLVSMRLWFMTAAPRRVVT